MTKINKEQRKHVRIYRNFILSYYPVSDPSKHKDVSQINNISQGGLNFSSITAFDKGSVLVIDLKTPFTKDKVELEGIVIEHKEKIEV